MTVEEPNNTLGQMDVEQLARQLEAFGLVGEANKCKTGEMTEDEARALVLTCYQMIYSLELAKTRHMRKHAGKQKKK